MIVRLTLGVVLALLGTGGLLDPAVPTMPRQQATDASTGVVVSGAVNASASVPATSEADDDVEVTEVEVVVPPVDESGEVVASPELRAADAAADSLAADVVVDDGRVSSEVLETDGFQTLGVTWPTDADVVGLDPQVRTRDLDGEWSDWQDLDVADGAPDAGSPDALSAEARGGTDPLWVGEADAVQVSFAADGAAGPEDLSLTLVDAPATSSDAVVNDAAASDGPVITQATYVTAAASSDAPTIISRSAWGARDQVCTPNVASSLVGAVVHHTAGSNNYSTVAQAAQQIRGDQAYHIDSRGWCDIGYNFLVDKWGNIYEGRANSLTKAVVGVHAGGFNTGTLGVSMLGSYDSAPPAATQHAVAKIIGWRLGYYGVNPQGTMRYYTSGGQNSSVAPGTTAVLPTVMGHRDVAYTACPGNGGYAALPGIRAEAAAYSFDARFIQAKSVVAAMYWDFLRRGSDSSGLATWSSMLVGGSGLPALVSTLTDSDEYLRLRITKAYRDVLARAPEKAGLDHWVRTIRAGDATVDDVTRTFLSTPEFRDRFGGTDEGYLRAMYSAVLGRAATSSEVAYWVGQIEKRGRDTVTDQIWFSVEAAGNRASVYYKQLLNRPAEPAGRATWATVLLSQGEGAVRIGIAGSEEYRALAVAKLR